MVTGSFSIVEKPSTLIRADDSDGVHDPLAKLFIETPHQVPDGVSEHAHESG